MVDKVKEYEVGEQSKTYHQKLCKSLIIRKEYKTCNKALCKVILNTILHFFQGHWWNNQQSKESEEGKDCSGELASKLVFLRQLFELFSAIKIF